MLNETDEAIAKWFALISPLICQSYAFSSVSIFFRGEIVYISCQHRYMAQQIVRSLENEAKEGVFAVKILVGGKKYAFLPPAKTMSIIQENTTLRNSGWAMLNSSVLDLMSDDGTVAIHSADRDGGYKLLTVCPYQGIEQVLCLPKEQLVGKAVSETFDPSRPETEVIAVTKERVIEEAIASQQKTTHTYEMRWNGLLWQKSITGVLIDDNEVLCITRNLQDYQRKYWENFSR
jgi:hypothetical protein